jgi:6-pyruvoyltetrahydropterin/6-carboxytetrahydropterin synthase
MNKAMYETGTAADVRAFHLMPGLPPPEGERHSHAYHLDVVVRREDLDERGMVVDLDRLEDALREITNALDGADLDEIVAPAMRTEAVTVEVFARWVHDQLSQGLGPQSGTSLAVRVWESPVAFGGYVGPLDESTSSA